LIFFFTNIKLEPVTDIMKNLKKSISLLTIAFVSLTLMNCGGGGSEPAPQKIALEQLKKNSWILNGSDAVKLGSTNRTSEFSGFTLSFGGDFSSNSPAGPYTFSVSGSLPDPSPWPTSGNWEFIGEPSKTGGNILRSDGVPILYTINSAGELTLQLDCNECGGARIAAVKGTWIFKLKK
jgi:hypothetical protein